MTTPQAAKGRTDASWSNVPVWDDHRWQPLPALTSNARCGTCVVGLGGSGLTVIEELLARGEDVIGIDGEDVGAGAAGRNGGFLLAGAYDFYHDAVHRHGRDRAHAIYEASLGEIERIAQAAPETVRFAGSRRLAATPEEIDDCKEQMRVMKADGFSVEWRDDDDGIGLFIPVDAQFNPLARCRTLAVHARRGGARLYSRTQVLELSGNEVVTRGGTIRCNRVIVAVDGKLEVLLPELSKRVRTARLQMLATAPTDERRVPCPMYFREGFEYWQQLADGSIALGGFRDKAGDSEWSTHATPTPPVQAMLEGFVREKLGVLAPIAHRWAACAAFTTTGLPIFEEVRPDVWAIGAYSGTGNVIGALCGRAVVALALDGDDAQAALFR